MFGSILDGTATQVTARVSDLVDELQNLPLTSVSGQMLNGRAHWTPPRWIDHTQTPRRNHAHDPLDE